MGNIQKLFKERKGGYNLRGCGGKFKSQVMRTTKKCLCVSVSGKLWNGLGVQFKQCPNIHGFKSRYKEMVLLGYKAGK